MKKILTIALFLAMLVSTFVPVFSSASDGELLIAVNWLTDTFRTVNRGATPCQDFNEKFDLSKSTENMLFLVNQNCNEETWDSDMFYIEDSGYYITEDTKYTVYFEVATPHTHRYSGVPFLNDTSKYGGIIMLMGCFSDNGDTSQGGGNWTEFGYAVDYANRGSILGEGYNAIDNVMLCHPALSKETLGLKDTCSSNAVTSFKFSTLKIEMDGLNVTTWYLDADKKWNRADSLGSEVRYTAERGSEIVLGTYCRNQNRHNVIRNVKLLQGVGMTYDQIWSAQQTSEPKPAKPVSVVTTEEPVTQAPEATTAPPEEITTTAAENKGCGSSIVCVPVFAVCTAASVSFIYRGRSRKNKNDKT